MVKYERVNEVLRIDCSKWVISPRVEDSAAALAVVIDLLLKEKGIKKIILVEKRENEYSEENVKLLYSIAETYERIISKERLLNLERIKGCENFLQKEFKSVEFLILEGWRKDPVYTFLKLKSLQKKLSLIGRNKKCVKLFLEKILNPIIFLIENSEFIRVAKQYLNIYKPGEREIYRKIFSPLIRPAFILTKFILYPPKNAVLIDKYEVLGNKVEILKIPGKIRYLYHLTPKEFFLTENEISLIETAKQRLGAEIPREIDFSDPEKAREMFLNLNKNLLREIALSKGLTLDYKKLEELAQILTRYTGGFGVLELLLADPKIQDVYINSPIGSTPIFIYHQDFEECETNMIPTQADAEAWATRFRLYSGRPLDEANPVLDTELFIPGGRARVAAITRTLSPEGLAFALRRHRERPWTFPLFIKVKMFNPLYAGVMSFIIDGGRSMLIAGGRGSGKTSLLSSIILEIMRRFRIIVQEDTLEIPVSQIRKLGYNIERLKSRSVITRVETELPADEALRTALRLGDSALIIGEVRSIEAQALFEAMRIGALANIVAGTIHGETAYGVFDRVVNDLGVPKTSFKAIDIITICNRLRTPDGLHTFRRVVELTEVRKKWVEDPEEEGGFVRLFEYSAKEDTLKPTETLIYGESFVLNEIAKRVKEWRGNWDKVWDNILLRAKIKETMVEYALKLKREEILEAPWVVNSNEMFHSICEEVREEVGEIDSKLVFKKWLNWFKSQLKT